MFVEALPLDHRLFDGADSVPDPSVAPVHLVLDGQQRLTAAYRACYARAPVKIKSGSRSEYHLYFFDMAKAVSSESPVEDAIFSIRTKRDGSPLDRDSIDYTDPFIQYEMGLLPTNQLFDFVAYEWAYSDFWDEQEGGPKRSRALQLLHDFEAAIASSFERYKLAVQTLKRPMSVAALCRVYEHVNMPRKNVELVE
jgi:hypothetical protein